MLTKLQQRDAYIQAVSEHENDDRTLLIAIDDITKYNQPVDYLKYVDYRMLGNLPNLSKHNSV